MVKDSGSRYTIFSDRPTVRYCSGDGGWRLVTRDGRRGAVTSGIRHFWESHFTCFAIRCNQALYSLCTRTYINILSFSLYASN